MPKYYFEEKTEWIGRYVTKTKVFSFIDGVYTLIKEEQVDGFYCSGEMVEYIASIDATPVEEYVD